MPDGCPNCIEHEVHRLLSVQPASPFERAPGVEIDRKLERRKQAPPPFAANLPTVDEQLADRLEVGRQRTFEQGGKSGHRLRIA